MDNRMILAASNIGWTEDRDSQIHQILHSVGIRAIEVAPGRLFPNVQVATLKDARKARANWERRGLSIVSMQALLFGRPELRLLGNCSDQEEFLKHISHVVNLAGELGAGPLVFGSPKNRTKGTKTFTQAKNCAVPLLRQIGELCGSANTLFCLEANSVEYGCDFMNTLEEVAEIVEEVNDPNIKMVADTGNMQLENESPEALNAVMEYISHVHISAPHLAPVTRYRGYLQQFASCLHSHHYNGVITLEMLSVDDNLHHFEESATLLQDLFQTDHAIKK